jgi:hypothetical protein
MENATANGSPVKLSPSSSSSSTTSSTSETDSDDPLPEFKWIPKQLEEKESLMKTFVQTVHRNSEVFSTIEV